ncbi:MAG: response regulator transcription factor [Firmicutes bacterium]|nr:response regulator transcription factor [Bacillota bacterium]
MDYKILVIDDEKMIVDMLKMTLEAKGYRVLTAMSGEKALTRLEESPDLILLDISMPGMDGLELCTLIRAHVSCPILFLTARVTEQDKIEGFLAGGDDYITKPFNREELLARIMAHLRREERKQTAGKLHFEGKLAIDYDNHMVFWDGAPLNFSNKEFEIIGFLSRNPGMVFSRETIYEKIWGLDGEGDSIVVKEHIRNIRNKLSVYTDIPYIETVWGIGYKWNR